MSSSSGFSSLLLRLDPLPVHEHLVGARHLHVAEHVRVTPDQLLDDPLGDVVDVPCTVVGRELRVERDLEQDVAELLAQPLTVVGVDRVEDLVRLLQQVAGEGGVGLLPVPRAPVRRPEPRHHAHEIQQAGPRLRRGHRAARNVGQEVVALGHEPAFEPVEPVDPLDPVEPEPPAGSWAVLRIGSTSPLS